MTSLLELGLNQRLLTKSRYSHSTQPNLCQVNFCFDLTIGEKLNPPTFVCLQNQLGVRNLAELKNIEPSQLQRIGMKKIKQRRFMDCVSKLNQRGSGAIQQIAEQSQACYNQATLKQWLQTDDSFDFEDPEPGVRQIIGLPLEARCFNQDVACYYEYDQAEAVQLQLVVVNYGDGTWRCGVAQRTGNNWITTRSNGNTDIDISNRSLQAMQRDYQARKAQEQEEKADKERRYQEDKARRQASKQLQRNLRRARIAAEEAEEEARMEADADLQQFLESAGAIHFEWELKVLLLHYWSNSAVAVVFEP